MNFVTADLTLQTWLTTSHLAQLTAAGATYPVLAMLSQMITGWSAKQAQLFGYTIGTAPTDIDNCGFLHDPLTVAASFGAVDPTTSEPFVQFQPPLRFVPGRVSTLYLTDKKASLDLLSKIVYCPDSGACVDEALSDPSLLTFRNTQGYLYRRIKHFSGYNVAALEDDVLPIEY